MQQTNSGQETNPAPFLLLALFGLILSVFGFLIVITLSLGFDYHMSDVVMIYYFWDRTEFFRYPKKPIFFMDIHRYFYEITIALFAVLSLYHAHQICDLLELFHEKPFLHIVAFFAIIIFIEWLYRRRWPKYFGYIRQFMNVLRDDIEGTYRKDRDKWFRGPDFRDIIMADAKKKKEKLTTQR